jgi:hypothetical protein
MLQAEVSPRGHVIVEQVIADLKAGPLAHLPSGQFAANAAWLVCAAITYNLTSPPAASHPGSTPRSHRSPSATG